MLIRWRKYRQSITGHKVADPRQDCFFSKENDGLVDVKFKQVIDRLLAHPNEYEIAWEQFGVAFDKEGREIVAVIPQVVDEPEVIQSVKTISINGEPTDSDRELIATRTSVEEEPQRKRRGRPKKRR